MSTGEIGFHEMYTQLSLASPLANATLRLRHRGSANVCKRRAYIAPLSFIYRLSMFRLHMSFPPKTAMETSGRISEHISPVNTVSFSLLPRSPVNFPTTNQNPTQLFSVSQCRNSSVSWAPVSVLSMKSPHHVNQHRKPQLHVQSQEMQAMDLVPEAIFRPGIKTVRNMAA